MNNYAIFGVMAGIALLTTTIVGVLPVQRALAVCAGNPFGFVKFACANDPRVGGGAFGLFPTNHGPFTSGSAGANSDNKALFGHAGRACAAQEQHFSSTLVCAP